MGPLMFSLLAIRIYKTKKKTKKNLCYYISEISQKQKDKYSLYLDSLILMNLKQSNP